MVGINAGSGFTLLEKVDQFALCGISPDTRLTFQELLKQAVRVAALLHTDFQGRPTGITPPFSSAVANDLKGWLQEHAYRNSDKLTAVGIFYANRVGHHGLTWQPYLKDSNGELLPRTHPAIWQPPTRTPPPTPPNKRRQSDFEEDKPAVFERKRRAYGGASNAQPSDRYCTTGTSHPAPERERRAYGSAPSTREESGQFHRESGPVPERKRSTYAATPAHREQYETRPSRFTPPEPEVELIFEWPVPERKRSTYTATPGRREEIRRYTFDTAAPATRPPSHTAKRESRAHFTSTYCYETRSPSPALFPHSPHGTQYSLNDLFKLAHIAGDLTNRRIAIACLPDQQDSVVTMKFANEGQLKFRVEMIDVVGRTLITAVGKSYPTTFKRFTNEKHRFLGRFAGAMEEELIQFALVMKHVGHRRLAPLQTGLPKFPFRDRSPSWKPDF